MLSGGWDLRTTMHLDIIACSLPTATTQKNYSADAWGEEIVVTTTFNEVLAREKPLDVLLIPGGVGTRASMESEIAFVKTVFPQVCPSPPKLSIHIAMPMLMIGKR